MESLNTSSSHNPDTLEASFEDFVLNAYYRARSRYEDLVEKEGKAPYENALAQKRRYQLDPHNQNEKPVKFKLKKNPEAKKKGETVNLTEVETFPPMIYWTLTEMNLNAEDQLALSHIPYAAGSSDEKFSSNELSKLFPDGVHGLNVGCGEYLNDYILYHMIKFCQEQDEDVSLKKVYRQIYALFPTKLQKNEFDEVIPDLIARFEPALLQSQAQYMNGEFMQEKMTPEQMLQTYKTLKCLKCALYDCQHHMSEDDYPEPQENTKDPFKIAPNPCGDECYLTHEDDDKEVVWSPEEESLIDLLHYSGIQDCCMIANTLLQDPNLGEKKTCIDVHNYLKKQGSSKEKTVKRQSRKVSKAEQKRQFRSANEVISNEFKYIPCNHSGPCTEECECFDTNKVCTKYCGCYGNGCKYQFPGCNCRPGGCGTNQCPCFFASWECDPFTCKNCNCAPEKESEHSNQCKNICMQRGLQKKLSVLPSKVAGWGLFTNEDIKKGEFIIEYTGEVVSDEESERRAQLADRTGISYLFRLNADQHVDATLKGNVSRFANHSSNPNCFCKVMIVNTDHRIGFFANKNISANQELFFDYSYTKEHQQNFLSKKRTKSGKKK